MQPQSPIHAIRDRLLQGLDKDYNVVDMGIVVEVISQLENVAITKEALEATRLGKHINELRRKASDKQLASRAKSLVKKWRELLMPSSGTATPVQTTSKEAAKTVAAAAAQRLNGHHISQRTSTSSQPSSRLTSPAVSTSTGGSNNRLNNNNHNHHPSSSMPSSASSSPGLSRPTTPNNNASRPVSPNAVPKTNVANKRLRKEEEDSEIPPQPKKAKMALNGHPCDTTNDAKKVKKKNKNSEERESLFEQKLLTARRSKVRTTQELVQELALRSSTPTSQKAASGSAIMANETKTELMNRFFESQNNGHHHSDVLSPPLSDGPASPTTNLEAKETTLATDDSKESVEDILAQLPPIDVAAVLADINTELQNESDDDSDDDSEVIEGLIPIPKKTMDDGLKAALVEQLHEQQHENVNGNFNHDGAFKEWHEVVTKETVNGDLLYILPYSVID